VALVHHEQCFGCGRTNLFGLLLEVERGPDGAVAGRCFIKQDHQGPTRGSAHEGIIATALADAMALACGPEATPHAITVGYIGRAPVGEFVSIEAAIVERAEGELTAMADATAAGEVIARARGTYGIS
jgi:acyl-coenzyme A thioesterase PaaI-like protein